MDELHKHNINLSDRQKNRLRIAFKKRNSAVIGLSAEQLKNGNNSILLTEDQHKAIVKAKKNNKGLRLTISYDQLAKNKNGGLLNEILEFIEDNVPYAKKVTPFVRHTAAPAIKEHVIPWLKDWINKELDKVIKKGSGLDVNTVDVIRSHFLKAVPKKSTNR